MMVHPAPTSSPFFAGVPTAKRRSIDTIPPRPPTPPRESPRSKKVLTKDPFLATDANIIIAPDAISISSRETSSPPSSSAGSNIDKPKKRVLWSPWTKYHKPDVLLPSTPIRSLIDPKSLKGILKPSPVPSFNDSPFGRPIAAHTFTSFTSMLESILQALASTERSKKLDTYITFANTLKAYDEIPDMKAMEEKLPILCGFIRRDLDAKLEDGGNTDSQLIQQAIKFLVILVWTPRLVEAMDDANATFFLENAITKIEDPTTPKIIVNHNLHLLAQQKFPPPIVTAERAGRIITALETLDERVTGKSITKERIDIYYKLLFQAKAVMLARVNDWMDNLFGGLLSSVSEVRNRALICVAEVSRVLGREKTLPKTLTNIFSRIVKGKRMFDSIKERLEQFIKDGEGIFVARMWGIVLLLVKSIGDHWEFFTPWLRIIEGCFNVSDKDVKVEAQVAWSKLIYSVNIGPSTTRKLLGLLCKPLEQYLDPKNGHSNTKKPRKAAMANVSVLLYYGFRPNAASKQLSEIWDVVVVGLVEKMALSSKDEVAEGVAILSAMFDGATKLWAETRVLTAPPMAAEDVPRLDPKWVRSNASLVLSTLEVALRRGPWGSEEANKGVKPMWKRFTKTLADAGSKEIKVSAELMEAVAHAFNMFQRIWAIGPSALEGAKEVPAPTLPVSFIKKFSYLILTTLESLGPFPFTEKQLAYDDQSKFSPAATPTHKYSSGTSSVVLHPPILHMFQLFLRPSVEVFVDEEYYDCVRSIIWRCVMSQDSRRKKLGLLAACANLLPHKDARELDRGMWQILGQLTRKSLPTPSREKALLNSNSVVTEFRDVVKILEWGCRYELPGWGRLFDEFCTVVQSEQGEAGVAAVVIEPLAEVLRHQNLEKENTASMRKGVMLIEKASYPKGKATADNFLRTPFGAAGRRVSGQDSYEKLYDLIDHLLRRSYVLCAEGLNMADAMTLLSCVSNLIGKCPAGSLLPLLKRIQEGLAVWVIDSNQLVDTKNGENATKTMAVWTKTINAVSRLPQHDGKILDALQVLITSLLENKRKPVVNATVKIWNDTFGKQQSLYYPKSVKSALKVLRPIADLSLPTFPDSMEDDPVRTPPQFSESQDAVEETKGKGNWSNTPSRLASPFSPRAGTSSPSASGVVKDTPLNPNSRRSVASGLRKPPSKPKHMDSQIDFAPIETEDPTIDSQVLTEHQKEIKERQSETATLFSNLGAAKLDKGKKPMVSRLLDETPSSVAASSAGLGGDGQRDSDDVPVVADDDMEISRISETQPEVESSLGQNETVSFISRMSNGDSSPQFLTKSGGEDSSAAPSSDGLEQSFGMDSPSKADWEEDEDVDMTDDTPADQIPEDSDASNILSDPPSIEDDDFVDAPDHPPSDEEGSPAPKKKGKRLMEIAVEVSPPEASTEGSPVSMIPSTQSSEYKEDPEDGSESGHSSPDAQIIDEERASHGLPATPKPSKGKRKGKHATAAASSNSQPEILDTIVISEESPVTSSPYRTRSTRLSQGKAVERAASGSVEATPSKNKASKPAQETTAEKTTGKTVATTPSKSSRAVKRVQEKTVEKTEVTPSKRSKSGKQVQRTPAEKGKSAETTPSKNSKSPGQPIKFSPPRTRSSAKKGAAETPRVAALLEPGSRKRKLSLADSSPAQSHESRQSSIENVASPTPKRRRGAARTTPAKRTRSSFTEEIPTDPDVSFVGETQLSYGSSIPDSQVDELVGPTPYAGRAPVINLFDSVAEGEDEEEEKEKEKEKEKEQASQITDVDPGVEVEVAHPLPRSRRRSSRRSLAASRGAGGARATKASKKGEAEVEEEKVEASTAESSMEMAVESMDIAPEVEVDVGTQESADVANERGDEVTSGTQAIQGLRKALQFMEAAMLTPEECREAENLVFEAFAKLRQRGCGDGALNQ